MADDLIVHFLIGHVVGFGFGTDDSFYSYVLEVTKINLGDVYFIRSAIICIWVSLLSHKT